MDENRAGRAAAAATQVASEVLFALGVLEDDLQNASIVAKQCVDSLGQPTQKVSAVYDTGDSVPNNTVSASDIAKLPDTLGTSPMKEAVADDIVEGVERRIYYLGAVNDDFEVNVAMTLDSEGAFTLVSTAECA
jgi:hypothetical protein